jgi:uncharacterized protein
MAEAKLLKERRNEILKIASRHGAYNVRVFGSYAHGQVTPESDLDLLVEVGPNHSPWFPASLIADLEELLGCKVDIVTQEALHWYIRDKVIQEAQSL